MTNKRFQIFPTTLSGLMILKRKPLEDERGYLCRLYCAEELGNVGFQRPIVQINQTFTRVKGTVRGLHFQYPPYTESKIISCLKGEIFDVAIDIRKGSPTFLQWHAELLSAENKKSILIPEGFAHGLQTLQDNCELLYLHTNLYTPESESGINIKDPILAIPWPLPISNVSQKDSRHPFLTDEFKGISI